MIHAEISIYPIGTDSTSLSFYVAKAIEVIKESGSVRYEVTPMGTIIESDNIGTVLDTVKEMTERVHRLGVRRLEVVLKIDSRKDKEQTSKDKMDSVKRHL